MTQLQKMHMSNQCLQKFRSKILTCLIQKRFLRAQKSRMSRKFKLSRRLNKSAGWFEKKYFLNQTLSRNISLFATHLLDVLLRPHHYLKVCFFTLVDLFSNTLNQLFGRELENTMNGVLDENTILFIVKELHKVVFDEDQAELSQEVSFNIVFNQGS